MTLDARQRSAGERPGDYATEREVREFWIDRCFETINAALVAKGKPPYERRAKRP